MPGTLTEMLTRCRGPKAYNNFTGIGSSPSGPPGACSSYLKRLGRANKRRPGHLLPVELQPSLHPDRTFAAALHLVLVVALDLETAVEPVPAPSQTQKPRHGNVLPAYLFTERFAL